LRTTAKGKSIYVHLFDWSPPTCEIAGIEARVLSAHLLANGRMLTFRQTEGKLRIDVPQEAPDPNVNVIVVKTY
jgi:alpha-L-fucosidase